MDLRFIATIDFQRLISYSYKSFSASTKIVFLRTRAEEVIYVSIFGKNYSKKDVNDATDKANNGERLDYHDKEALKRNADNGYSAYDCEKAIEKAKRDNNW